MRFEIYKDLQGAYRWRLIGNNNSDIIADSGQGYSDKTFMIKMIHKIKDAPIKDKTIITKVLLPRRQ